MYFIPAVFVAYLLGSLTFAIFVCKVFGLPDPRTYGSKNPGSSNVLRSGSKSAAASTLLLDALKGALPVWLVQTYGAAYGLGVGAAALVGFAAFLGHLYPVFFKFKGGKGVATAAGVIFAIHWALGLATLVTWLIVAYLSRYSSLAALVAAVLAPAYYLLLDGLLWYAQPPFTLVLAAMCAMLVYAHRANIDRLLRGVELKIGRSKDDDNNNATKENAPVSTLSKKR